jgi:hypothetical protein
MQGHNANTHQVITQTKEKSDCLDQLPDRIFIKIYECQYESICMKSYQITHDYVINSNTR